MSDDHNLDRLSPKFQEHLQAPRLQGVLDDPSGVAVMTGQCGDSISMTISVVEGRIEDIRSEPMGCGYTVVCASVVSEMAHGMGLDEVMHLEPEDVAREVDGLPEDHMHCARLALNVLGEAIVDHLERSAAAKAREERKNAAAG